jgi:hypothetical protein
MAGGMNLVKFVLTVIITLLLSGCGLLPHSRTDVPLAQQSSHTLQELCDSPKHFFATQFNAENLRVGVIATKPLTEKIGIGNGCNYQTSDNADYLGYISLDPPHAVTKPAASGAPSTRTFTIDGVSVTESSQTVQTTPSTTTPTPYVLLTATIDGWQGEFEFLGRDDTTTQAGAQVLVNMIRTLRN